MNKIEELKKLKSLLDAGAITEAEYNDLILKTIDEQPSNSEHEFKVVSESMQKLQLRTKTLKNWGVLMAVLLIVVLLAEFANNYTSIKHFIAGIAGNTKTEDVIGNNDSINMADKNIIYQDGQEIGRIVKKDFHSVYPHMGSGVQEMNIPDGKMWTPLYYEFSNGRPIDYELTIFSSKRNNGWNYKDSYVFEDSKHFFVSIKFAKQYYKPLSAKTRPAILAINDYQSTCSIYFFEESIDY